MSSSPSNGQQEHAAYDSEIRYGFLIKVLGGTVIGMLLTCAFIYWLYFLLLGMETSSDPPPPILSEASEPIQVPGPLLLALPEKELAKAERTLDRQLNNYGWIDEASGLAHLPIDIAIDKIAHQGLGPATVEGEAEADPAPGDDLTAAPSETDGATE